MVHYVAGNLQSALNEWQALSPSAFISPPRVRKCQSKRLNSLDRWPTVILLLSMLHITTAMVNLSVDQGHSSQLATISLIAAMNVHPWESPQRKLGEISVLSGALTSLQIAFFSSCLTAFETCKNLFEREGKRFLTHSN